MKLPSEFEARTLEWMGEETYRALEAALQTEPPVSIRVNRTKWSGEVAGEPVTRDMMELCADTGNVYETVAIIGKRANQISVEIKNDLSKKLAEFASYNDNLEEVFENREQIEISRYYEKLPKPDLIATQEYIEGKIYYRNPAKEKEKLQ